MPYDEKVIEPILWEIRQLREESNRLRQDVAKAFQLIYEEYDKMVDEDEFTEFSDKYGSQFDEMTSKLKGFPVDKVLEAGIDINMLDPEQSKKGMWEYLKGQGEDVNRDEITEKVIADLANVIETMTSAPAEVAEDIAEEMVEEAIDKGEGDAMVIEQEPGRDPHEYFMELEEKNNAPSPYDE